MHTCCLYPSLMPTNTSRRMGSCNNPHEVVSERGPLAPSVQCFEYQAIVRAAWALGSFRHMVLLPSLHGQEVLPCHVKHMNTTALAICRTWKSALLQQSAAKQFPNSLFLFLLHLNVYHCIMQFIRNNLVMLQHLFHPYIEENLNMNLFMWPN